MLRQGDSVNNPSSSSARRRGSHRLRLMLYLTIGLVMAGVALAGYLFFGPSSDVAIGAHVRPADVATHVPSAPPTGLSVSSSAEGSFTHYDLAAMQLEMETITQRMNGLMGELRSQDIVTSGSSAQPMATPTPFQDRPIGTSPVGYGGE